MCQLVEQFYEYVSRFIPVSSLILSSYTVLLGGTVTVTVIVVLLSVKTPPVTLVVATTGLYSLCQRLASAYGAMS